MLARAFVKTPSPGEDEFAGVAPEAPTNDIKTSTCTSAMSPASILTPALPLALANSMAKYSKKHLQQIFKTVLEAENPALSPQPFIFSDGPCERLVKARFFDFYRVKTNIECYNFCQQCKDYFATTGAKGHNRIPFATNFF